MGKRFQRCLIATQACVKSNHRQCVQYMYGSFVGFSGSRRQLDPARWAEYRFEQGAEEREQSQDINTYTNANLIPALSIPLDSLSNYT